MYQTFLRGCHRANQAPPPAGAPSSESGSPSRERHRVIQAPPPGGCHMLYRISDAVGEGVAEYSAKVTPIKRLPAPSGVHELLVPYREGHPPPEGKTPISPSGEMIFEKTRDLPGIDEAPLFRAAGGEELSGLIRQFLPQPLPHGYRKALPRAGPDLLGHNAGERLL